LGFYRDTTVRPSRWTVSGLSDLTTILGADEAVGWVAEDAEAVAAAARG
jgi:hypothetical protein